MTPKEWLDRLKPGDLPILRHTHAILAELSPRRDEITAREIAAEVLADPLATFQAVHAINKRVGQRYGTEVTVVEHALMMQGIGVYLDAALRLPVLEDTPAGRDPAILAGIHALIRRAQHAAWQARDFAVLHADVRAEEVQVAALIHYVPELLLWLRAPQDARRLRRLYRRHPAVEAETLALGLPLPQLRQAVLAAWNIPALTRDLLDDAHAERARQGILIACIGIARLSDRGWWDEALLEHYVALAGVENTPVEAIISTVHMNAARAARAGHWLPAPAAAAWGPMIPGPWPPDEDDEEPPMPQAPTPAPPAAAVPPAPAAPAAEAAHGICPMPDKQVFQDSMKGIEGHMDGSYTLNQMSAVILKGLHSGLGLSRILFAMVTPDGKRVKARFTLGIPVDNPLRNFEFELANKDLFSQLMGKMQGVWINDGNREKLWPMVRPALREMIGEGGFYAMSLFNGARPVGLIYADRGHGECGLDSHTYTDFKMLCLQAARGLAKVRAA